MDEMPQSFSHFRKRGYCILKGVLSTIDLDAIMEATRALQSGSHPMSSQVLFTHTKSPANTPPLTDLMHQWLNPHRLSGPGSTSKLVNRLKSVASSLFNQPMQIYQDLILSKSDFHDEFPWHQDAPFWPIEFRDAATFWAPLCEVNESNGGLRLALDEGDSVRPAVNLHTGYRQDGSGIFRPQHVVTPSLVPGDVLVISPTMLHASGKRQGGEARVAYASVFVDQQATWNHQIAPNHPMCKLTRHGSLVSG